MTKIRRRWLIWRLERADRHYDAIAENYHAAMLRRHVPDDDIAKVCLNISKARTRVRRIERKLNV